MIYVRKLCQCMLPVGSEVSDPHITEKATSFHSPILNTLSIPPAKLLEKQKF